MRVKFGAHVMIACALALGACGMDGTPADDPAGNNPKDDSLAIDSSAPTDDTSIDAPRFVSIPEELSFENLPDAAIAGGEEGVNQCYVKIKYCSDPRHSNYPSYCSKGCSPKEAQKMAKKYCQQKCKYVKCSKLWYDGSC